MVISAFTCDSCGAEGKITVKDNAHTNDVVVSCHLRGADIFVAVPSVQDD